MVVVDSLLSTTAAVGCPATWASVQPNGDTIAERVLQWSNLSYTVRKTAFSWQRLRRTEQRVTVLNDVSGSARSGQLIAIMGPSGAGKTSLLAAISQRLRCTDKSRTSVAGHTTIDGHVVSRRQMIDRSAFVAQFDIASVGLTAREHLHFVGQLRGVRPDRVDLALDAVGLRRAADARVAVMSGGERKRLSMAAEILTDPNIIFCDEPTTGLDSYSALSVVQTLRNLADGSSANSKPFSNGSSVKPLIKSPLGKTVLCSIHQPTSDVFQCFTHIILMRAGTIVFQGSVPDAMASFARMGRVPPKAYNAADFLINTISDPTFADIPIETAIEHRPAHGWLTKPSDRRNACWLSQVWILLRRSAIESRRSMREFVYKLTTFVLTAIFIGGVYVGVDQSGQKSVQDITGFVFNLTAQIIYATAYNVVYYYPSQMPILRRETGERIYSLSAFYVANMLGAIPRTAIECFTFLAIVWPFVSFVGGWWQFCVIGVMMTLMAMPATAYGLMLSGLFESMAVATSMAPMFDVGLCLAAGVYIRLRDWWWVKYATPFFYANEAVLLVIWKEIEELDCDSATTASSGVGGGGGRDCGTHCLANGDAVLRSMDYGTTYATLWSDCAGLIGCALAMHAIGYVGVRRMVNRSGFY